MNIFATLVKKEVRENLRWAVPMSFLMLGALIYSFKGFIPRSAYSTESGIFGSVFQTVTSFAFPLFAAALGFLCIIFESRGDRWAFLVHRPVSPSVLFWAKLTGAFLLYTLAGLVPYLIVMIWISQPNHLPMPFHWPMALSGLAKFLAGGVYIPAAMLVALRDARWYASRTFPLAFGLIISFLIIVVPEFHQALLVCIIAFAIAAIAARHLFVTLAGGQPSFSLSILARACTFLLFLPALWVLGFIAVSIANMLIPSPFRGYPYQVYTVLKTDQPGIEIMDVAATSTTDLAGKPIPNSTYDRSSSPNPAVAGKSSLTRHVSDAATQFGKYTTQNRYCTLLLPRQGPDQNDWFIDHATSTLVCYDADWKYRGGCGPQGFSPPTAPPPQPFPGAFIDFNAQYPALPKSIVFSTGAYVIDFNKQTVTKTFTPNPGETILLSASTYPYLYPKPPSLTGLVLLTTQRLLFVDPDNTVTLALPLPPSLDLTSFSRADFYRSDNRLWLMLPESRFSAGAVQLLEFDSSTKQLVGTQNLPSMVKNHHPPTASTISGSLLLGPTVPALTTGIRLMAQTPMSQTEWDMESAQLRDAAPWLALASILGAASCLTLGAFMGLRRGRLAIWALLGASSGPMLLLLMPCLIAKPTNLKCLACSKRHRADQPACPVCKTPSESPRITGAEVFAPLASH